MTAIEQIRAELDAATPGPWEMREEHGTVTQWEIVSPNEGIWPVTAGENDWGPAGGIGTEADAILIAHAPTYLAALLDVAEAAEGVAEHKGLAVSNESARVLVPIHKMVLLRDALEKLPQKSSEGEL